MISEEQLADELRTALAHLDDPPYLEQLPLAERIASTARPDGLSRGQFLQRALRLAIEALDPGLNVPITVSSARCYQVLQRYAISKDSMLAIARDLDLGERQAYRYLRQGILAVARVLADLDPQLDLRSDGKAPQGQTAGIRQELERISVASDREVQVNELLSDLVKSARRLAEQGEVDVVLIDEAPGTTVVTNRVMLRQAVLNLLSHAVRTNQGGTVTVRLSRSADLACILCSYRPGPVQEEADPTRPGSLALHLLDDLGVRWEDKHLADGRRETAILVPLAKEQQVLIVDDNPGIAKLFQRYLRHQPCRLSWASNAGEALEMVSTLKPNVIILDVMMPERDGWEVLEWLQGRPDRAEMTVIVCSIINDPQLAAVLGADAFLHKPVTRAALLQALNCASSSIV